MSEQSSDVAEWLKKADPFYLNICEWFYNSLIQLDMVKKNTKWESKSWYDGFKRLLTIDGVDYFLTWHMLAHSEKGVACDYPQIIQHSLNHNFGDM